MFQKFFNRMMALFALMMLLQVNNVLSYKRNYEDKYIKANVPLWKQRACEKAQKYKANSHYVCDDKGDVKCLPGWQGDLCQVPMCRRGCDPMNGYCQRPGECRCRIGYTGELCDKCIPLPGCQHGDCTKPFECICRSGWDGLFCTEPTCRPGCHNTRGYCELPGECRCRVGWAGRNCSECSVLPGCQHGTCTKPLDCQCLPGYTGLLCQTPICKADCHKQHGYCKKPGECRCKVGWTGVNCDSCFPYPGCVNGDCEKPWECNCKPEWGGILCDEKLVYCKENPKICKNEGKCISLTKEDGSYQCRCKQGFLGKNCEIIDEFLLTSTSAPRITPPAPVDNWHPEEQNENLSIENELQNLPNNNREIETTTTMGTEIIMANKTKSLEEKTDIGVTNVTTTMSVKNLTLNVNNKLDKATNAKNTEIVINLDTKLQHLLNSPSTQQQNVTTKITSQTNTLLNYTTSGTTNKSQTGNNTILLKHNLTTILPLSKLDEEKNLLNMPLTAIISHNNNKELQEQKYHDDKDDDDGDDEDENDEECTDDNDDECEYVDDDDDGDEF